MPELPEVEIMARNTARWMEGHAVLEVDVCDPDVVALGTDLVSELTGQRVDRVWRRAKHLLMDVGTLGIAVHFRMTGKLVRLPHSGRVRLSFLTAGGRVGFVDTRRLGSLRIMPIADRDAWLSGLELGPDAYPEVRSAPWWKARFTDCRREIKPALLDQKRVAGIGNILASEICHAARVSPFSPAHELTDPEWERLAEATPRVIGHVIASDGADEIRFVGEHGAGGSDTFVVYQRTGSHCRRCGETISMSRQAQRSTFWCPGCQPTTG